MRLTSSDNAALVLMTFSLSVSEFVQLFNEFVAAADRKQRRRLDFAAVIV